MILAPRLAPALIASLLATAAAAADLKATLPTGQAITPTAAPGSRFEGLNPDLAALPDFLAGQASATALSPDGRTLLILTSGYNRNNGPDGRRIAALSGEYVFVYDVSGAVPVKRQVLGMPNSFLGIAWAPSGKAFYVAGGVDDNVVAFEGAPGSFARGKVYGLGHKAGVGAAGYAASGPEMVKPEAGGLAVSPDGRRLLVANVQNDSVSLIDLETGAVSETDLRPGGGQAGGTYPRAVAWSSNRRAYVASERDREIISLDVGASAKVRARIRTQGQPVALLARQQRLYAALDNSDAIAVIDTDRDRLLVRARTAGPGEGPGPSLGGAGSNALALSGDGRTLYVSNGGENAVAVVGLGKDGVHPSVRGLIPTGWYPTGVAVSADGRRLFVVNGKSNPGPNPKGCRESITKGDAACRGANQYVWQLEKAGFLSLPVPGQADLARLSRQVAVNNHADAASIARDRAREDATVAFLRAHIRHVIYVVKENRSYDQVLGDLGIGDGDPKLNLFPESMAPNHHWLARQFVDLDAFRASGESSNTGWNWTTAARTNDWTEREGPVNYGDRGLQYDQEGGNRNVNVALPTAKARHAAQATSPDDPDVMAGQADVAAPDGPDADEGHGYLWDAAIRAGLSVRNWGFYGDYTRYEPKAPDFIPPDREPFASKRQVFYTTKPALMARTDPYYRGFDQTFPDFWRLKEFQREFKGFEAAGQAPSLMLVRLPHDHFGGFKDAIDGVNTVETQMADNDYAVGALVEMVSQSRFSADTLVVFVEDDAQNGADHVDAHRTVALFAGPYVKQGAVVSAPYTTVDLVRTVEAVLGLKPLGLNDARARPMTEVFDVKAARWSYHAVVPPVLRTTSLPLPPATQAEAAPPPMRSAQYWESTMAGQDFSREDRLDTARFNAALWRGLKGDAEPAAR